MDSEAKDGNIDNFLSQLNALNKVCIHVLHYRCMYR